MGLDMYLEGRKFIHGIDKKERPKEDGYELKYRILELGYWRKHPNLHGYIVQTFADGKDDCQDIELGAEDLQKIINAIKANKLPETTGFFFGKSDGSETPEDIRILEAAIQWLKTEEPGVWRNVVYRASW